jgi:hypothetical protein
MIQKRLNTITALMWISTNGLRFMGVTLGLNEKVNHERILIPPWEM